VCSRDARWVRSMFVLLLRFAPLIAHRLDPIPRLHGMLFYHARELGNITPSRGQIPCTRTISAQGLPDGQRRGHRDG
jgi:hypothetical protein